MFWTGVAAVELAYPHIFVEDSEAVKIFRLADFAACVFFLIDVAWRYLSAADKIGFWKWGIVDLISAIPFITVLRYGRIISAARIILSVRTSGKGLRFFFPSRAGSTLLLAVTMLFAGTIFSSVMVLHFERGAESANIKTYFDALWWAAETVSTVGYGDVYPVTIGGKIVAMVLMMCGVGLFSLSAALFAAWIISEVRSADTAVFGGGDAPAKKTGVSAEAAKINCIVSIRFLLCFIATLKRA